MYKRKFRGLFVNAVLALSLISLALFLFIGIHLVQVNTQLLQQEIFQTQQTVAGRLSAVVHAYITHVSQSFTVFLDLHTNFGGHAFLNQQDLTYLRQKNSFVVALMLLNKHGEPLLSEGTSALTEHYAQLLPQLLDTCITRRTNYIGDVFYVTQQGWLAVMAFPIYENLNSTQPGGILVAEISLHPLKKLLAQDYPLEMDTFIVNAQQEVIFYNGRPGGVPENEMDFWNQKVRAIQEQMGDKSAAEVTLPDKRKWLVACSSLLLPGWKVYVVQPANVVSKLVLASLKPSRWGVAARLVLIIILFILGVSYWVIVPITRPLERLRKAALRVRDGNDIVIRREDVGTPPNEIGDLAEVFVEMSEVLLKRRQDLLAAQNQLAKTNQALEKRVEDRTRELQAASVKLVRNERLATMGQMASIISHEIRNPLAVISNATRLIKMLAKPEVKIEKQIAIIESEIKQANSIISEVLGYVRSREPILNKIEVNSYIHDILTSYPLPSEVKLVEKLAAEPVHVKIDTEEIKQAVRNLLTNAVEAMQNQGTLTVGIRAGKDMVCIYVADSGPGVPPDIRQQIFAPFFTTKARGTGLGLAVVEKAISRHQGKLFISSEEGKGACFQIYLKIYRKTGDTRYGEIG